MKENQLKAIRDGFMAIHQKQAELQNAVTWLSMSAITLNKLVRVLLSEKYGDDEAQDMEQTALQEAAKELAKMTAAMKMGTVEDTFSDRFGVSVDWGRVK